MNCSEFAKALNDAFTGFLKHQQLRLMGTQGVFLAQNWPLGRRLRTIGSMTGPRTVRAGRYIG